MEFLIFIALLGILGFLAWDKFLSPKIDTSSQKLEKLETEKQLLSEQNARLNVEIEKKSEELGKIETELKQIESEKNELSGKNKQMFVTVTTLQEQNKSLQFQVDELSKKTIQFESHREQKEKGFEQKVTHLEESRKALEDERMRIRREDEERLAQAEAERNRIWNEHENTAIAHMKEVCMKPELAFSFYENTTLPEGFDGKLKPDFLLEFLGQYIIFDAKMTRSEGRINDYILDQVKNTVKKIEASSNKDDIYFTIFFIVPYEALQTLKKTHYYENGYSFYIISLDAFEPILHAYNRIRQYDITEAFDPKERENIVNVIAAFDQHIHKQNAVNILTSLEGIKVSQMSKTLSGDIQEAVESKKKQARIETFKKNDLQKLILNPNEQIEEMKKLVTPSKAPIEEGHIEEASQTLF